MLLVWQLKIIFVNLKTLNLNDKVICPGELLGQTQEPNVKLHEITESICSFFGCQTLLKNQHHSSI